MNEKNKLREAKYFFKLMSRNKKNKEKFLYNVSAFLTAARSILQYSLEEAKNKINGQIWYDNYISRNIILQFFKEKRDVNIHEKPITTKLKAEVIMGGNLQPTGSLSAKIIKRNGEIINLGELKKPKNTAIDNKSITKVKYSYFFDNWSGNEDLSTLSKIYLKELNYFISDGIKKGFIDG